MDTNLPAPLDAAIAETVALPDVPTVADLLRAITEFLARHPKMTRTRFGIDAFGEGGFVKSLENGREPSLTKAQRVIAFIREFDAREAAAAAGRPFSSACSDPEIISRPGRLLSSLADAARTVS